MQDFNAIANEADRRLPTSGLFDINVCNGVRDLQRASECVDECCQSRHFSSQLAF